MHTAYDIIVRRWCEMHMMCACADASGIMTCACHNDIDTLYSGNTIYPVSGPWFNERRLTHIRVAKSKTNWFWSDCVAFAGKCHCHGYDNGLHNRMLDLRSSVVTVVADSSSRLRPVLFDAWQVRLPGKKGRVSLFLFFYFYFLTAPRKPVFLSQVETR